jgi:hypothetical protein
VGELTPQLRQIFAPVLILRRTRGNAFNAISAAFP